MLQSCSSKYPFLIENLEKFLVDIDRIRSDLNKTKRDCCKLNPKKPKVLLFLLGKNSVINFLSTHSYEMKSEIYNRNIQAGEILVKLEELSLDPDILKIE